MIEIILTTLIGFLSIAFYLLMFVYFPRVVFISIVILSSFVMGLLIKEILQ